MYKFHNCDGKHQITISAFEKNDNSSDQNNNLPDGMTTTNFSKNRNNILLQTATAFVSNTNNLEATTKLMLDSESQRSYISSELRHMLFYQNYRQTERLLMKTFRDTNFKCQNVDSNFKYCYVK